jgi:hypothetical protein
MPSIFRKREKINESGRLKVSELMGEELEELLKSSVAPPPPDDRDEADDDGRLTFSPSERARIGAGLASYAPPPPPRRRTGPFLIGLTAMTTVVVAAFGALAWLGRPPQATAPNDGDRTEAAAGLEQRDRELIALRAAHQQEIAVLVDRIEELEQSEAPGSEESIAELSVKLEEVRAESFELEIEAEVLEERRKARGSSSRKDSRGDRGEAPLAGGGSGRGELDDNPYDGVTSATNLNNAVWARAEAVESEAPSPGRSSVDELIDAAVRGPSAKGSGEAVKDRAFGNTLPGSVAVELPLKPPRSSVRQVMGSLHQTVRRCGGEPYQRLVVELTVSGSTGRVTAARTVDRIHAGTSVGACAAQAVRLARFPKFQRDEVVIKYPFDL